MARKTKTLQDEIFDKLEGRFISLSLLSHPERKGLILSLKMVGDYGWDYSHFSDENFQITASPSNLPNNTFVTILLINNKDYNVDNLFELAHSLITYNNDLIEKQDKLNKLLEEKQNQFNKEIEKLKEEVLGKPKKLIKPIKKETTKPNVIEPKENLEEDNNPV